MLNHSSSPSVSFGHIRRTSRRKNISISIRSKPCVCPTRRRVIEVLAECADGRCKRIRTTNVPCYAHVLDETVEVDGLGTVTFDICYGGAYFALVDAAAHGLEITPDHARALVELGEKIKDAIQAAFPVTHPVHPEIGKVTFVTWLGPVTEDEGIKSAPNATIISPGKVDRSPCGTGCSARLAVLHAKGVLKTGDAFVGRSIIGSRFDCRIESTARVGDLPAIVPSIRGRAWITGTHQHTLDPQDPWPGGYKLSDTWPML